MTNRNSTIAIISILVSCFFASAAIAMPKGKGKVRERTVRTTIEKLEGELRRSATEKMVQSFMQTRQMNLITEKASELLESGVARNETEAAELAVKGFAANRIDRAMVGEPLKAIGALRSTGKSELAREGILFAYNAATTMRTRSSRINEENPQGADVVMASLNALKLSREFEGSGITPLKEMLGKINKEFETTRDIEQAAEIVVKGEKRKEFVENCKK